MGWRLACCSKDTEIIQETQDVEMIVTYNGLESCIQNSPAYKKESGMSRGDGITTDSINEEAASCCHCSTNKNALGSVSAHWNMIKRFEQEMAVEWEVREIPPLGFYDVTENSLYRVFTPDVEPMQERFAKLLLGDDITGGREGLSASLALSNAITNLAASVFGELWRLEPLPEERKSKWRTEMDWLLTPTKYMVELVPSKRIGANGRTMEETLDSMVSAEFWYTEGGSWAEGRSRHTSSMRRWLVPLPQLQITGLSENERAKMLNLGTVVHQIYKAAKSINETVLLQLPVPTLIKDALPKASKLRSGLIKARFSTSFDNANTSHLNIIDFKGHYSDMLKKHSGKESLGEELYKILSVDSQPVSQMLNSLNLKSKHSAIETINRLEAAVFAWKEKVTKQNSGKSPVQKVWSFKTNPILELEKIDVLMDKAEALIQLLKTIYPNLPQTFLEVVKIQYGRDVGHSILEAYSRVLRNLAFKILSRIRDILQEDVLHNPHLHVPTYCFPGTSVTKNANSPVLGQRVRHSLIEKINKVDGGEFHNSSSNIASFELSCSEPKTSSVVGTPRWSGVWGTLGVQEVPSSGEIAELIRAVL
ncbi:hypothetical protein RHMOL_Rhmol07G0173800 [Rhododendron molle]|uniref:Uncharacterized protein n=1 Tax=Rhododendron molle TaxID=49168 RepID=A0ACC0N1Y0_RHOML|nr:hypothetical protein RHMOL_Rhmol07G0173800 [Rhododendron molle]